MRNATDGYLSYATEQGTFGGRICKTSTAMGKTNSTR